MFTSGKMENGIDVVEWAIEQPLVTVKITNTDTNKHGVGHAYCDPTDRFDSKFGFDLAYTRALLRLAKKNEQYYANVYVKRFARS